MLNHIINRSKRRNIIVEIIDNNHNITDKHIITNRFNSYFVNIDSNLASKIKPVKSTIVTMAISLATILIQCSLFP